MFSRVKNFFNRHRQKFMVGGIVIGGAYLCSRYARKLIREWQEKETRELLERTKKQQHYESIERTCNQTALTMAHNLRETITKLIKTDELIEQLKVNPPNKIEIWEKLKILAFTKLCVLIYTSSLLILTLRIQLNLIGGYMFRDSTGEMEEIQVTSTVQEKYLEVCQYYLEEGVKRLCEFIEGKVKLVLKDKSLKEKLTVHDIEQIFWAIQTSISNDQKDPCKFLPLYILPEEFKTMSYGPNHSIFNNLIAETTDLLESEEIIRLCGSSISWGFSFVMDQLADYFKDKTMTEQNLSTKFTKPLPGTSLAPDPFGPPKPQDSFVCFNNVSIPMAKLIPIVNGLVPSHSTKEGIPLQWIQRLILMDSLKIMGANIYETFSSKG